MFLYFTISILNLYDANALTLEEAIELAKENLPAYRSKRYMKRESRLYEYRATLSPYLPSLDLTLAKRKFYVDPDDYRLRSLELRLSYILYDGGKRYSQRHSSRMLLRISDENLRESLLIQAESLLAQASERIILTRLNILSALITLEKTAGIME